MKKTVFALSLFIGVSAFADTSVLVLNCSNPNPFNPGVNPISTLKIELNVTEPAQSKINGELVQDAQPQEVASYFKFLAILLWHKQQISVVNLHSVVSKDIAAYSCVKEP